MIRRAGFHLPALLACCAIALGHAPAVASDVEAKLIFDFNSMPRTVRAIHPLLPLNHVGTRGGGGDYYVSRQLATMARAHRVFTLRDIDASSTRIELRMVSPDGGKLTRISLMIVPGDSARAEELVRLVLSDLFEFGEAPHTARYVGCNSGERRLHVAGCGHIPAVETVAFAERGEAERRGFRPCAICFSMQALPPIENFQAQRAEALTQAKITEIAFPPVATDTLQAAVQSLGDSLVACLPFEPRGFEYRVRVVQMETPNALSLPTGFVYVSDRLVESIDSRVELAFVLAHEIAHVEMHHPRDPVPDHAADLQAWAKLQRDSEMEADLVAQVCLWKWGVAAAATGRYSMVLRKLEYFVTDTVQTSAGTLDLYPSDDDRCAALESPVFAFPTAQGCGLDGDGNVLLRATLLAAAQTSETVSLVIAIEGTVALPERARVWRVAVQWKDASWLSFEVEGNRDLRSEGRRVIRAARSMDPVQWAALAAMTDGRLRIAADGLEWSTEPVPGPDRSEKCELR